MARIKVAVDQPAWLKLIRDKQHSVAEAAVAALNQAASDAVQEGRQNIAGAGKFTGRWVTGLRYKLEDQRLDGEPSLQAKATIFHTIGLMGAFEHGATIQGKPLLWIPTEPGAQPQPGTLVRRGTKLVSATIRGTPVLFDAADRDPHRKPLYIGVPSVTIRKRLRITEIVLSHAKQLGLLFLKYFKDQ
jgi:Family of unknown function (DUF6441)